MILHDSNLPPSILLCGERKKNKKDPFEVKAEIPSSLILGAVEILGGALVWILPFPATKELSKNKMDNLTYAKSPKIDDRKWGCITLYTNPFSIIDFRLIWRGEIVHFIFRQFLNWLREQ